MKIKQLLTGLTFFLLLSGCTENKLSKLNWLSGSWFNDINDNTELSNWTYSEKIITNKTYIVTNKDTVFMQKSRILEKGGTLVYIMESVEGNGTPSFKQELKMTSITDNEVTFENPVSEMISKVILKKVDPNTVEVSFSKKARNMNGDITPPALQYKRL